MALAIIFMLIALLGLVAIFRELRKKNMLGLVFALLAVVVFGWFSVMTFIDVFQGGGAPSPL
ncbi:DUF2759 domain-containing protein [Pueribacillus sp. YX66]|uniref:DUF2759 domain-containing protein n=1 Tax=Pueribacillus sp. YX66 TaxID=3229242 RepID=UPI00358D8EA0